MTSLSLERGAVSAAVLLAGLVVAAFAAPVAGYSVTLATFGATHVLSKPRHVGRRFGRRRRRGQAPAGQLQPA